MANETAQQATPIRPSISMNEAIIEGKVQSVEQPKDSEYTYYTIIGKGADEFTRGATNQISQPASNRPFAREGDVIKVKVLIGGYGRRYNGNLFVTNTLNFVELL